MSGSRRERACGLLPTIDATEHPFVRVRGAGEDRKATWHGVGMCGHIWTCPVCSRALRAARTLRTIHAVEGVAGRWQMLTLTVRHQALVPLLKLLKGIMAAWRRTRQGGRIQRVWASHVRASVRATEVMHGVNGWHPHIHVLLATEEWDDDDRLALFERFRECVRRELGEEAVPSHEHGMVWSRPFDGAASDAAWRAKYIAKFSCEVNGIAKEATWSTSKTPWELAEAASRGDARSLRLWQEYEFSTKGRRAVELDDRAAAAADRREEDLRLEGDEARENEEEAHPRAEIPVTRDELWALRRFEAVRPTIMHDVLVAARDHGASGVRDWVTLAQWSSRIVTHGNSGRGEESGGVRPRAGPAPPEQVERREPARGSETDAR